jgi:hypothetical protein
MLGEFIPVIVRWRDTTGIPGWHKRAELEEELATPPEVIESTGWLIDENDEWLTLAGSVGRYTCGDLLKIPRGCIVEVETPERPLS